MKHATRYDRGSHIAAYVLVLTLLMARPGFAASRSPVQQALDGSVRIEVTLRWPDQREVAQFSGSGWTRACVAAGDGFEIVVSTAGHVIDIDALDAEARVEPHSTKPAVKVVMRYLDGRQLCAGREDLRLDPAHDYGEIRVHSMVSRAVLPAGAPGGVSQGDHLFTIASPGLLCFAYFDGHLMDLDASLIQNAPSGAWLTSVVVAPGASGAPVMTDDGSVVGFVDGWVEFRLGLTASVIVALPALLNSTADSSSNSIPKNEEVVSLGILDGLLPLIKLAALGGGAVLVYRVLAALERGGAFSPEMLDLVTRIGRQVVLAVEQANPGLSGADKKQRAEDAIGEILSHLGLTVPRALIDAAIESAVLLANALGHRKEAL